MTQLSSILKIFISFHLIFLHVTVAFPEFKIESRIKGGDDVSINEVPFIVQIWIKGEFSCAGTIASNKDVITAAQCVYDVSPTDVSVVHAENLTNIRIESEVSKIIIPSNYTKPFGNRYSNIAVLKLKFPIAKYPLKLPRMCLIPINEGKEVELFGWGTVYPAYGGLSIQLQTATLKVVDRHYCSTFDDVFCAEATAKGACDFDAGGPAFVDGRFCGIIFTLNCGEYDSQSFFTKIDAHLEFLDETLE